jgi:hypothetical protein
MQRHFISKDMFLYNWFKARTSWARVSKFISLTATEKKSYHLLIKTLEQRFGNARHQNRWLSRFETRTRQPNESIATFGDDLRQMARPEPCSSFSIRSNNCLINAPLAELSLLFPARSGFLVSKRESVSSTGRGQTELKGPTLRMNTEGDMNERVGQIGKHIIISC